MDRNGANVADLVFVVYGSSTALVPSVGLLIWLQQHADLKRFATVAILSSSIGTFAGWLYGFTAISKNESLVTIISKFDFLPGAISPFNAAATALGWAIVVFIVGAIVVTLQGRRRS